MKLQGCSKVVSSGYVLHILPIKFRVQYHLLWQLCISLPTQVEGEEVVEVVVEWDEEGVEGTWAWLEKPFV